MSAPLEHIICAPSEVGAPPSAPPPSLLPLQNSLPVNIDSLQRTLSNTIRELACAPATSRRITAQQTTVPQPAAAPLNIVPLAVPAQPLSLPSALGNASSVSGHDRPASVAVRSAPPFVAEFLVGGWRFAVSMATLAQEPTSLLYQLALLQQHQHQVRSVITTPPIGGSLTDVVLPPAAPAPAGNVDNISESGEEGTTAVIGDWSPPTRSRVMNRDQSSSPRNADDGHATPIRSLLPCDPPARQRRESSTSRKSIIGLTEKKVQHLTATTTGTTARLFPLLHLLPPLRIPKVNNQSYSIATRNFFGTSSIFSAVIAHSPQLRLLPLALLRRRFRPIIPDLKICVRMHIITESRTPSTFAIR